MKCKYFKNGKCIHGFDCSLKDSEDLDCPSHSENCEDDTMDLN